MWLLFIKVHTGIRLDVHLGMQNLEGEIQGSLHMDAVSQFIVTKHTSDSTKSHLLLFI